MYYYVYVLVSSKDDSRYIGFTSDLKQRILDHNSGKSRFTKAKMPWKIFYFEAFTKETKARKREIQLKKSSWHKKQLFDRIFEE